MTPPPGRACPSPPRDMPATTCPPEPKPDSRQPERVQVRYVGFSGATHVALEIGEVPGGRPMGRLVFEDGGGLAGLHLLITNRAERDAAPRDAAGNPLLLSTRPMPGEDPYAYAQREARVYCTLATGMPHEDAYAVTWDDDHIDLRLEFMVA
jgi:hypothetical protein